MSMEILEEVFFLDSIFTPQNLRALFLRFELFLISLCGICVFFYNFY
jgi:hypothetical protein